MALLESFNNLIRHSQQHTKLSVQSILFRLHGSYERLWAGQVSEALVDLTGGLAERWSLQDFESEEEQKPEQDSDQVRRRRLDLSLLCPVTDECAISCATHSLPGGQKKRVFISHL